jgi:hypothetical protein
LNWMYSSTSTATLLQFIEQKEDAEEKGLN